MGSARRVGDARLASAVAVYFRSDDRDIGICIQLKQRADRPGKPENEGLARKTGKITGFDALNVTFGYPRFLRHLKRCQAAFSSGFPDFLTDKSQLRQLDLPP